ncbi:hypothetical protein VE01_02242 [Pseudogymnoascus verrucosus]|uniref:Uncharacterized protein n=1 Tax=Pseudogymnoascus verrucosus TaxID=342668 RepID=A0A1B8GVJ2_9PEZI|nr:uncharacterized protein VE01_02242 [Pseudogymnoascus verrucosus]OBT99854.1 hypothetical protein VE01_02242 [Pseudogymnoascus verrucosus]
MSTPQPPPPPSGSPTSSDTLPRTPSPKSPSISAPPQTLNFQPPGIIITSAPEEPFIRSAAPSPSSSRFAAEERSRRSAAPSPEERSLKTPSPSPSPSLTGAVVAGPSQGSRSRSSSILGAGVPPLIPGAGNGYSAAGVSGSMPPPPAPTLIPDPPGSTRLAAFPRTRFSSHHVEFEGRPPQQPELLATPLSSYFEGRHTVDPASIADSGRSSSSSSRPYSRNAAMVIPQLSGPASQHGGDPSSSGFQRSGPVVGTGTGQNEDAVPRRRGRSAFERVQDFMRGACMPIAGRKRGHEEMEDGWALTGMVGDGVGNGFGNGLGNGNANGFGNENGFVNANGFGNGFGNGNENGNENGVDGYFHEEDGDVDMDGANAMATDDAVHGDDAMDGANAMATDDAVHGDDAMDGDATIHGATMDAVETGTEHTEPQNGYEDHDEALATAPRQLADPITMSRRNASTQGSSPAERSQTSVVVSSEAPTLKGFARLAHRARISRLAQLIRIDRLSRLARAALYWLPFFGIHHVFMITISISIIFLSILVAGCTTTGLKDVYLLSLSYQPAPPSSPPASQLSPSLSTTFANLAGNSTTLQVRAGYIGMCISAAPGNWTCSRDADALARALNGTRSGSSPDPLNILWIAKTFRDTIVFDGLIFASIALMVISLILLVTYPQWHTSEDDDGSEVEVRPFPSRAVSKITLVAILIAAILMMISILWQHVATATASSMGGSLAYGAVRGGVGAAAMVLGWGGGFLVVVAMLGILVMVLSIQTIQAIEY